ncbi:MAG: ferritin family protein [Candidatus Micrarchaeota archaeon]
MVELCAALDEGIKLERDSKIFYARNAKAAKNDDVRALFEKLEKEEKTHEDTLKTLGKGKACPLSLSKQKRKLSAPKIGDSLSSEELEEYSTILLVAMGFEQKSKGFYDALALATQNSDEAKTFRELAVLEQKHYELLDSLYDQLNYYRLQT